jgi:hypothetical protein
MGDNRAVEEYGLNVDGTVGRRADGWLRWMASIGRSFVRRNSPIKKLFSPLQKTENYLKYKDKSGLIKSKNGEE